MRPQTDHNQPDTSAEFFERLYQRSRDPWDFRGSAYERDRYAAIIASLGDRPYRSAFEPGCAIGELTALLAPFCEHLEAIDFSATAVETARGRCRDFPQVHVRQGALPDDIPTASCDLIVFSEVGYYFTRDQLADLVAGLWAILEPEGQLVACHWLGHSEDHLLHGSEVHEVIGEVLQVPGDFSHPDKGFALQRWSKR